MSRRVRRKALSKPENAQSASAEPSLIEQLKDQAGSMVGMAGMFVVTILLAMKIQPFYDHDEIRAFGSEGATKAGFILLELFYLHLTLIIYLARIWRNSSSGVYLGFYGLP